MYKDKRWTWSFREMHHFLLLPWGRWGCGSGRCSWSPSFPSRPHSFRSIFSACGTAAPDPTMCSACSRYQYILKNSKKKEKIQEFVNSVKVHMQYLIFIWRKLDFWANLGSFSMLLLMMTCWPKRNVQLLVWSKFYAKYFLITRFWKLCKII